MADSFTGPKGTLTKKKDFSMSRSLLHHGNTSFSSVNSERLSEMSNARLQKLTSNNSGRSSFICKKDVPNALENYHLEYSTYLLRKVQSRVLGKNKVDKEENLSKCFVSLKRELEDLLEKYVKLRKEVVYFQTFVQIIKESDQKIENGKKLLTALKENDFESVLKSLSNSLDHTTSQLQLADIDKSVIEEAFMKRIWGLGSEIDECLKKIGSCVDKNKEGVSKIAGELVEIKKLLFENTILKEKFYSVVEEMSNEILTTFHKVFTNVVKKAFDQREQLKSDFIPLSFDCDLGFLLDEVTQRFSSNFSEQGSPCHETPVSSSTPQH